MENVKTKNMTNKVHLLLRWKIFSVMLLGKNIFKKYNVRVLFYFLDTYFEKALGFENLKSLKIAFK